MNIRRSLKNIIVESLPLKSDVGGEGLVDSNTHSILSRDQFSAFVDETIFQSLRYPPLPLPQNRDEIMQSVQLTYLQEYIYAYYGNQARLEGNNSLKRDSTHSLLSG